jgi:hypothetical protein
VARRAKDVRAKGLADAIEDGRVDLVERKDPDKDGTVLLDVLRERMTEPNLVKLLDAVSAGGLTRRDLQGLCGMVVQFALEDMEDGELSSKDGLALILKAIEAGRKCINEEEGKTNLPGALLIQVNVDGDRSSSAGSMPTVS